jgi:hypothetical protein
MADFITFDQSNDRILFAVMQKFKSRAEVGQKKYGTTMDRTDLSIQEWMDHAIEESMDFILYLQKLKTEIQKWDQNKQIL